MLTALTSGRLGPNGVQVSKGTHRPDVTLLEIIREKSYDFHRHFIGCR